MKMVVISPLFFAWLLATQPNQVSAQTNGAGLLNINNAPNNHDQNTDTNTNANQ